MIITRAPFRISLFGGSTDYESFYKEYGATIIGSTIDKYTYTSFRLRPSIVSDHSVIAYSKLETPSQIKDITHPLIRETLKYCNIKESVDLHFFADIPSRTGLGGSSSFCVSLLKSLKPHLSKKDISKSAIEIERHILNESGGIQDQIWAAHGGLNIIEIKTDGTFYVKPLSISAEFINYLSKRMVLVYTKNQRTNSDIPKSHENKNKIDLLSIARESLYSFKKEDVPALGNLLLESWKIKKSFSDLITNPQIEEISTILLDHNFYGFKLLGSGGSGFVLGMGSPNSIKKVKEIFKTQVLDFSFETEGVSNVLSNTI